MKHAQPIAAILTLMVLVSGLMGCGPKSTEPTHPVASTSPAEACAKHSVTQCPLCFPELIETLGFCSEHGVPEAVCTRCRKELEKAFRTANDWCSGHGVPESQCEACNPGVLAKYAHWVPSAEKPAAVPAGPCAPHEVVNCPFCFPALLETMGFCSGHGVPEAICTRCRDDLEAAFRAANDWCGGHGLPESQCEACNPGVLDQYAQPTPELEIELARADTPRAQLLPSLSCTTSASVVRLDSASVAERAGLIEETVSRGKLRKVLEAPATVEYDSTAYARLSPRASGTIAEVRHKLGDKVQAGDVLVMLDSAALGSAKSETLQALAHVELWSSNSQRERRLLEKGLATEKEAAEAETMLVQSQIALSAAEQKLWNLGLSGPEIESVQQGSDTSSLLPVLAPFSGVVVEMDTVLGEYASPENPVVGIADTSKMWVMVDVDQAEIRLVETGQPVLLAVEGWRGETLGGRITWMSSDVDVRTRTVKVRAEFENPEGLLRAHSFGSAKILTRDVSDAVLVPKSAVQWEGCCNVAFERSSATEFVPHKLRLGYDAGDYYEVLSGLSGGESVVTQGSFLLKTELKKGSIGAGCCEVDHLKE